MDKERNFLTEKEKNILKEQFNLSSKDIDEMTFEKVDVSVERTKKIEREDVENIKNKQANNKDSISTAD